MSSSTTAFHDLRPAQGVAAAAGAIYGLALARYLFELDPQRFGFFGGWPGALLVAGLVLGISLAFNFYLRHPDSAFLRFAVWAPLALALPVVSLAASDVNPLRAITVLIGAPALLLLFSLAPPAGNSESTVVSQAPHAHRLWRVVSRAHQFFPLLLFLVLLLLYLRTLAPAVGLADTFEFQVDVARLGIAHGSGYPLLMLIGRLFSWLPVGGTLAFRANLSSAFFAALAAVGVERIARRLGADALVALLGGLAFGVSPTLWSRAVEIEVFALNAAFVAALVYLCLDLVLPRPSARGDSANLFLATRLQSRLMLLAFLFGLSLTNHLTTLFLGPACLMAALRAVLRQRRAAQRASGVAPQTATGAVAPSIPFVLRRSSFVLLALLLGLSVYLYIPLRWPAVNHGQVLSLAGFLNILSGNEAKGAFQWRLPFQDTGRFAIVWGKIAGQFGWPGLVLALVGIAGLLGPGTAAAEPAAQTATSKPLAPRFGSYTLPAANAFIILLLLITSLGYIYFALAFNVPDPSFSSYLIPVHLIAAVLMALGVQWLAGLLRRANPKLTKVPAISPHSSPPYRGLAAIAYPVSSLLFCAFCLFSLRSIWQTYPLVDRSGNWAAEKLGELMLGQPLAQGAAILADSEKIAPLDNLQIAEGRRPDLDIIVLPDEASYRAALDERLAAGQVVYVGRYLPGLGAAYSLRSVGPLAEVSAARFASTTLHVLPALARPVGAINLLGYATATDRELSGAAPGELDLTLIWQAVSAPADNLLLNLRLVDSAGQPTWQKAGSVPVSGLYPTNAWRAGEIISDFYSLPIRPDLAPGAYQLQAAWLPPFAAANAGAWTAVAPVTVLPPTRPANPPHLLRDQFGPNWLLGYDIPDAVAPGSKFSLTLYWLRTPASSAVTALGETHSLAAWPDGAIVPVVYHRIAPAAGQQIDLAVDLGVPARCGWLTPLATACPLPQVRLAGQPAADGAVNFDNQILLTQAHLASPSATPGGNVTVNLEWQALRALSMDYTVFVHLLGPDGRVHGQMDRWPVSGTRATSGWVPGEHIPDPYTIALPADAPPGAYHIEIGLYLLASGERLPVLNADSAAVDDRWLLAGLQVTSP